jgi:hypothetical protein
MKKKLIDELWILLTNGTCAVHRKYRRDGYHSTLYIEQLTSGYIAAIFFASKQAIGENVQTIKMHDKSLYYLSRDTHMIVVLTSNSNKEKKIRKSLAKINSILENCCAATSTGFIDVSKNNVCRCGKMIDSYLGYGSYNAQIDFNEGEGYPRYNAGIHRSLDKFFMTFEHYNTWKQTAVS